MAKNPMPDWRNPGGAKPRANAGRGAWQPTAHAERKPRKPMARTTRLMIAFAGLVVVVALMVVVIQWLTPPRPASLILAGAHYDTNLALPHNVPAWKAVEDLRAIAVEEDIRDFLHTLFQGRQGLRLEQLAELKGDDAWKRLWDKIPTKIPENALIFVLALHGGVDRDGPFFFLDDRTARQRVPLAEVLGKIKTALGNKQVLLVLEPALISSHWQTGSLQNDFVRKLKEAKLADNPNLAVLCASDVDQMSWNSDEWQQSIFGHYLLEGLQGAADTSQNGRITVRELADYVAKKVEAWSLQNRGVAQTPILLGNAQLGEVELAALSKTYVEQSPEEAPGTKFAFSDRLKDSWEQCKALSATTPAPCVYTPQLWRTYLEMLLRLEQLERAGYSEPRLADLKRDLDRLADAITVQARLDADCAALSLPWPAALGLHPRWEDQRDVLRQEVEHLLNMGAEARAQKLTGIRAQFAEKIAAQEEKTNTLLLRMQLTRALLAYLSKEGRDAGLMPRKGGEKPLSQSLLAQLEDPSLQLADSNQRLRPSEAQLLVMLQQDLDRASPPELAWVKKALEARLRAEEAALAARSDETRHPYSEVVFPQGRDLVVAADQKRRQGEDWLFASAAADQQKSQPLLAAALRDYDKALARAEALREAYEARDRALADLPFLASWLAHQKPADAEREKSLAVAIGKTEELAQALKTFAPRTRSASEEEILQAGKSVRELHEFLQARYADDCRELAKQIDLHDRWHNGEALLSVPLLAGKEAVELRRDLLGASRKTSAKFHRVDNAGKVIAPLREERDANGVPVAVQRARRLAFAALEPFVSIPKAQDTIARAGQAVGEAYAKMSADLHEAFKEGVAQREPAEALAKLTAADWLTRGLPASAEAQLPRTPFAPPETLRRLRLLDLLRFQMERTLLDHWYAAAGENILDRTYYRPAVLALAKSARQLFDEGVDPEVRREWLAPIARVEGAAIEWGLKQPADEVAYWTSERTFPLTWKLELEPGDKQFEQQLGIPMFWVTQGGKNLPRAAIASLGQVPSLKLSKGEQETSLTVKMHALYRGQHVEANVRVEAQEPEVIVHRFPPPKSAAVAVQLDKTFTYGAVCIVLDCSGSMQSMVQGKMRFDHALEALAGLLKTIPNNTEVSLLAFAKTSDNPNARTEFQMLREPSVWQHDLHLQTTMGRTLPLKDTLKYGSFTPLARALVEARDRGFRAGYSGPKIILALTDGDDTSTGTYYPNQGWPDPKGNAGSYAQRLRKYLEDEFRGADTELHLVAFLDAKDPEAASAENQFSVVRDPNKFNSPGSFTVQPRPEELLQSLDRALRPRLKLVNSAGVTPPPFPADGLVGKFASEGTIDWELIPAGQYRPGVPFPRNDWFVNLAPGEHMLITLVRDGNNRIVFKQTPLAERYAGRVTTATDKAATRSVTMFQNFANERTQVAEQLVAIEAMPTVVVPSEGSLEQRAPRFVWLETRRARGARLAQVRWWRDFGFPATMFRLEASGWGDRINDATPATTNVWWTDEPADKFSVYLQATATREPQEISVGGIKVVVEDISPDDEMEVQTQPERRGPFPRQKCLVVRLSPKDGKRALVQLDSAVHQGEEHRFYASGKYTAIFWGIGGVEKLPGLRIIALDPYLQQCNSATLTVAAPISAPLTRHTIAEQ